jgi:hypothetical protein
MRTSTPAAALSALVGSTDVSASPSTWMTKRESVRFTILTSGR